MTLDRIKTKRTEIAEAITTGTGIRTNAHAPSAVVPPCGILVGGAGKALTMTGDYELDLSLHLLIAKTRKDWQEQIDDFLLGDRNVFTALNGVVGVEFETWDGYGTIEWSGAEYWSVRVPLAVRLS